MEPCVVLRGGPLHENFHAMVLLDELKVVRVHVASVSAVSSIDTQFCAETFCGLMQCEEATAGGFSPSPTLRLTICQRPGCALRFEGLVQKPALMSHRVPPLTRQAFKASLWDCSLVPAWPVAHTPLAPTASAAQVFEKLMMTWHPSPFCAQEESALALAPSALLMSTAHA